MATKSCFEISNSCASNFILELLFLFTDISLFFNNYFYLKKNSEVMKFYSDKFYTSKYLHVFDPYMFMTEIHEPHFQPETP